MSDKSREEESPNTSRWLITYTDLCILLLTFFVLLISMSMVDQKRKKAVLNSLVGAFGVLPGGRSPIGIRKGQDPGAPEVAMQTPKTVDLQALREISKENNLDSEVYVFKQDQKIVIRIHHQELFRADTQEFNPNIQPYLIALAQRLAKSEDAIEIRGHTDAYEDMNAANWSQHAWETSARRAMAVYDFFGRQGISATRMSAHGFSYHQPLLDSMEFPHLRHKNKRLEIVLGPNANLPSSLTDENPSPSPLFNYKNFFFRLFPVPEKTGGPPAPSPGEGKP
jgi:chemotaxis protein MotB